MEIATRKKQQILNKRMCCYSITGLKLELERDCWGPTELRAVPNKKMHFSERLTWLTLLQARSSCKWPFVNVSFYQYLWGYPHFGLSWASYLGWVYMQHVCRISAGKTLFVCLRHQRGYLNLTWARTSEIGMLMWRRKVHKEDLDSRQKTIATKGCWGCEK